MTIFDEVKRVLRKDGLVFCNLGDSYSGSGKGPTGANGIGDQTRKQGFVGATALHDGDRAPGSRGPSIPGIPAKNLLLLPERFAIGMQDRGWTVRQQIVWAKKAPMPESVRDRFTRSWEPIWMFSKSPRYFFDQEALRQPNTDATIARHSGPQEAAPADAYRLGLHGLAPHRGTLGINGDKASGANMRDVWLMGPSPLAEAHYASFPPEIPRRCILAGSRKGDTVLDPFLGSGTTALVADRLGRDAIGIELNPEYAEMARKRLDSDAPLWSEPVEVVPAEQQAGLWESAG